MATQPAGQQTVTGWVGWVWFGGIMLVTLGIFQAFQGLIALFDDGFSVTIGDELVVFNLDTWGWAHLIMGGLLVVAGVGVLGGTLWGRILGVIVAAISVLAQLTILPVYPIWALIVIALDALVIYALVVHGEEAAAV
ncbi:DUF7144 family membrane protein [Jiangella alkaliphila]|uniref:DUF7144 domain-containing protein n=1 Tax=Jiangella alkaliphila TaxID=419479 RepID=A0A1H2LD35_9ACTN|nr:hypothetical protein [Jiangella alkaliphila]SDU78839.1 hypothetical protein SAMN04488563_5869 [Jiangella alkaliphila]